MERGSVVDAQIEKEEQCTLEIEKCKDWKYWYINYCRIVTIDGKLEKPSKLNLSFSIAVLEDVRNGTFRRLR
jgi:hypothetical protein